MVSTAASWFRVTRQRFKVGNVGALRGGSGRELVRMVSVQGNLMLLAAVGGAIQMVAFIWQASRQ